MRAGGEPLRVSIKSTSAKVQIEPASHRLEVAMHRPRTIVSAACAICERLIRRSVVALACVALHAATSDAAKSAAATSDSVRLVVMCVLLSVISAPFRAPALFDIDHPTGGGNVQVGILNEQSACTGQCCTGNGER